MVQNAQEIKQKILSAIRIKGPGLPVQIARTIQMSPLFAGAFLSELVSEKQLKMSAMKVGGSPLYLIPGQEPQLEKFFEYIKGKEKEALLLLKNKKFLEDSKQQPAIRVALRSIRDFAIPFKHEEVIHWRYFTTSMEEFQPDTKTERKVEKEIERKIEQKLEPQSVLDLQVLEDKKKIPSGLNIFDKKEIKLKQKSKAPKPKKKSNQTQNNKFFNRVKEYLQKKSIGLIDIESFSKNNLALKVEINGQEQLLIAHNKKRIDEKDIIQAHKKAEVMRLPYTILSLGKPAKKTTDLIAALKNLTRIREIE